MQEQLWNNESHKESDWIWRGNKRFQKERSSIVCCLLSKVAEDVFLANDVLNVYLGSVSHNSLM